MATPFENLSAVTDSNSIKILMKEGQNYKNAL